MSKLQRAERLHECTPPAQESWLTSRLQKGGALLPDMRMLVTAWSDAMAHEHPMPLLARVLPKSTMARRRDTFTRVFRPRFIEGCPPNAWRLARVIEEYQPDLQVIRPFYYWITARAEVVLSRFVADVLYPRSRSADRAIRIQEVVAWLNQQNQAAGKSWTPTVTRKVAHGILAALRDFGVLEGVTRKRIAAPNLAPEASALIAFCLHDLGATGRALVRHPDWRLFLIGETGIEHILLECHQHGWVRFEMAGELCRTEFPNVPFEEYAHAVLG